MKSQDWSKTLFVVKIWASCHARLASTGSSRKLEPEGRRERQQGVKHLPLLQKLYIFTIILTFCLFKSWCSILKSKTWIFESYWFCIFSVLNERVDQARLKTKMQTKLRKFSSSRPWQPSGVFIEDERKIWISKIYAEKCVKLCIGSR